MSTHADFQLDVAGDDLLIWRDEFPILDHTTYMISHSLGAMPRRAADRLREYAEVWATRGVRAWEEGWWDMPVTVGDLVGGIIGAPPGSVVMQQNVTLGVAQILSCLEYTGTRNRIVYSDLEFPSVMYILDAESRRGARPIRVPSTDGVNLPLERLLDAIDESTAIVPVSHVLFRSSAIVDIPSIVTRAKQVGALVLLDAYQSAGTVPIDVAALEVDFAVGGSVKWLCGGPGAGWLYVRPDLRSKLQPRITGWMAHTDPFKFEPPPIRYTGGPMRFLHGTPNIPALYAARGGFEIVSEIGVSRIRAKSMRQTSRLIELAEQAGLRLSCPRSAEYRGGTVVFDVPRGEEVAHELVRREVLVDYRPGAGIRIAPHFYTSEDELERTIEQLSALASPL